MFYCPTTALPNSFIIIVIIIKIATYLCAICAVVPIWCWHTTRCVCVLPGATEGRRKEGWMNFTSFIRLFIPASLSVCVLGGNASR